MTCRDQCKESSGSIISTVAARYIRYLFLCGCGPSSCVASLGRQLYKHLQFMKLFMDMKLYLVRVSSSYLKDTERNVRALKIVQGEANHQLPKM